MPTTDAVGALSLTNIGPLTTTFTAPSSCETTDFLYGWKVFAVDNPERGGYMAVVGAGGCDTGGDQYEEHGDCHPHGDKLDELAGKTYALPYYSPANACPSGYQTVGVAAMSDGSASLSGIFTPNFDGYWESPAPTTTASDRAPEFNWLANRLTSALGPQETIVACCPSGYEVEGSGPQCYSTFPVTELASSTGCAPIFIEDHPYLETASPVYTTETWEYDGTTFTNTNWIPVQPTGTEFATTTTYTFDDQGLPTAVLERFENDTFLGDLYGLDNEDTKFVGGSHVAVMYLFYDGAADESGSESSSAVETSGAEQSSGAEESGSAVASGEEAEGTDEPSAASALAPANLWRAVGGVMAVWTVGAIAGVGLMAAL